MSPIYAYLALLCRLPTNSILPGSSLSLVFTLSPLPFFVIPAQAGIHRSFGHRIAYGHWMPAFAGMTMCGARGPYLRSSRLDVPALSHQLRLRYSVRFPASHSLANNACQCRPVAPARWLTFSPFRLVPTRTDTMARGCAPGGAF